MILDGKVPAGPLDAKWSNHKDHLRLVNPSNRRKHTVIVVGTGLAGASAAASLGELGELGYRVQAFTILDSPRRAHSIAAQGGINAAKNYKNDGDSIFRLFYDTVKGGDFRAREANVHRLAEVSVKIIDHCVAQGVPFAREYGGLLDNRSFGGAQLSRTFYARGQTGQQLLIGAYGALMRQVDAGRVEMYARREMLDLVVIDGRARGIVTRDLVTGAIERWLADAVLLATGGYGNLFYLSTNAGNSNVTAAWRCAKRGAYFANPCFVQIHPTCIPASGEYQSKLTLMSESLRNDGRVWVPKTPGDRRAPQDVPESERSYFLEERYPSFGNLVPRDVAARNCKSVCEAGQGVGPTGYAVYLDFADAIRRLGATVIRERYGNLFQMYERIVGDDPYQGPMRIYPAVHYTMGGLWVDYDLMSNVPGLFVLGEANFSDHGANRLGASALMQGLADGYFIVPYTLANYLAGTSLRAVTTEHDAFAEAAHAVQTRIDHVLRVRGDTSVTAHHRRLGQVMWDKCSIARAAAGMAEAKDAVRAQRDEFWQNVRVPGEPDNLNKSLELALRVADFLEFGELVALDALARDESCGCHFREEHQTADGEARRDDERFAHVAAWEWHGASQPPTMHVEPLHFESVALTQRSYK